LLTSGIDERNFGGVTKTYNNDEISPKIDLNDPYIRWNTFFVEMEAVLMNIVRSVNRSWIYDSYFSLYRPIHLGELSWGNVRRNCPNTILSRVYNCTNQWFYISRSVCENKMRKTSENFGWKLRVQQQLHNWPFSTAILILQLEKLLPVTSLNVPWSQDAIIPWSTTPMVRTTPRISYWRRDISEIGDIVLRLWVGILKRRYKNFDCLILIAWLIDYTVGRTFHQSNFCSRKSLLV